MMIERKRWFCVVLGDLSTNFYFVDSLVGTDLILPNGVMCGCAGGLHYDFLNSATTQQLVAIDMFLDSALDNLFLARTHFQLIERNATLPVSTWRLVLDECSDVVTKDLFALGDRFACRDGSGAFAYDTSVLSDEEYLTLSDFVTQNTPTGS